MQYQTNVKIVIDKRKLDTLIRLGVSDENLLSLIKTQRFEPTGDSLIDEYLSTLIDVKEFSNWGGSRKNSGRKPKNNQLENQDDFHLEKQDDFQLENQDESNLEDKDIDIESDSQSSFDKNNDSDSKKEKCKKKESLLALPDPLSTAFNEFWADYPKQRAASKQNAYKAFLKAIKEKRATVEKILSSVKEYAQSEEVRKGFAKGAAAWLNDDRFNSFYGQKKETIDEQYQRLMMEDWNAESGSF